MIKEFTKDIANIYIQTFVTFQMFWLTKKIRIYPTSYDNFPTIPGINFLRLLFINKN